MTVARLSWRALPWIPVALAAGASFADAGAPRGTDAAPEIALNRDWAERAFSRDHATSEPQDRLFLVQEGYPGDTKVGLCAAGGPLRLGEKTYARGIGVNSHCVLGVSLTRPAERFRATIGLDRNVDGTVASVAFHVAVNGKDAFATPVVRPADGAREIDVGLSGAQAFHLIVDEGGDGRGFDQADWAEARVVLQDGREVWLDDLARRAALGSGLPFSFVYGGRPSSELLPSWTLQLSTERIDASRERRDLTLTDPATGLEVRAEATVYTDSPGVDWVLRFTNTGASDTPILEQVQAVDATIAPGIASTPVLHRLRGSTCSAEDWLPFDQPLARGPAPGSRVEFGAVNGRSSADSPFFHLDWGAGGVITAVGWSGQWRGSVEWDQRGDLRIRAGMERLRAKLRPGERIRSPRILQLYSGPADPGQDGPFRAYNLFRRTMLRNVVPKVEGRPAPPPFAHLSTAFYELNTSTEANVLSHLSAILGLGFEVFWLDAYWTRDGFPAGMGHYGFPIRRAEPPDRFPRGLKPIGEAARREGLQFLVWFEPERVHPGTALSREHPEWVISPGHDGGGLFNLGIPEARDYMTRYLRAVVEEYGMDWLRIDFNIDPLPFWEHLNAQEPDRTGIGEIRYVEGLYAVWDELLRTFPSLRIDNCASGGRRIDLETCSRATPLWRSDNTCDMTTARPQTILDAALKNQVMSAGLNRYAPFSTVGQMGASPYFFRSGFNGGIAFAEDCRPPEFPRKMLSQAIAEGKRLRRYFQGNFYVLSEVNLNPREWCVLQYHLSEEGRGMVVAFRRHESPYGGYWCDLHEIDAAAAYDVTFSMDYTPSAPVRMAGSKLRTLKAEIDERPGSLVVEYARAGR